ncbi:aminodeoxychorismate synthase, component I [Orenia metallireducens]|jgi:para-aminobenzoate synthetase component 1|uniref:aminodeoxychorismate synthase n=1 Tax=Orenia metallireducens TaxID=1413210 RepID=A0A1C0A5H7_9FIRM|nr:aminodeoxychorismate synthase component I [Orenia metallireducens]OCL25369.1 aminodeoxychorismate synthase, component I [Orenia metallireducens]
MIKELKTELSAFQIYTIFKDEEYSFILDSAMGKKKLGRYSFISANPFKVLKFKDSSKNPLEELREELNKYKVENETQLPFVGGAVGYLSYDLVHYIEDISRNAIDDIAIPELYMGLYDWVIVVDHLESKTYLATPELDLAKEAETIKKITEIIEENQREFNYTIVSEVGKYQPIRVKSNFKKADYLETIEKVRRYIKSGDVYQANLTQRFEGNVAVSSYELYRDLRRNSPAPFGAFLNFGDVDILSNSPERFIHLRDRIVETRPIKGTRPRGKTLQEDEVLKSELLNSEKDRAELLMIVDLERNDLGKVCTVGTVKVPELFELEEYSNVHHLVATVKGELREDKDLVDLLQATFPGGSITGAPKIRAMEIIDELEPTQRSVYTGSIGYIGFNGSLDLNIAIRTIIKKKNQIYFQVGGGITWDSNPKEEYQETLDKAESIMRTVRGYYEE